MDIAIGLVVVALVGLVASSSACSAASTTDAENGAGVVLDDARSGVGDAADATKKAGGEVLDAGRKAAVVAGDGWMTTKVKAKFADEVLLAGSDITVETTDRWVTLKGRVGSAAARARAESIAAGTEGVAHVVNHLAVKAR